MKLIIAVILLLTYVSSLSIHHEYRSSKIINIDSSDMNEFDQFYTTNNREIVIYFTY